MSAPRVADPVKFTRAALNLLNAERKGEKAREDMRRAERAASESEVEAERAENQILVAIGEGEYEAVIQTASGFYLVRVTGEGDQRVVNLGEVWGVDGEEVRHP